MLSIIEKVKDLFKCKAEKSAESLPQQEELKAEEKTEEQPESPEGSGPD
jgi:hypothetical protein